MQLKLQAYCETIMEAAWLAAAVAIPLFFNVSSTQTFEPDKVFLLKFLAIISGAACLVKRFAIKRPQSDSAGAEAHFGPLMRHQLVLLILALTALYTLSSFISIYPAASWLGSYKRAQGTATFYCYVVLFLVVLSELRNSAQVRRLQYASILVSLPVAGYGILQHFGADFIPWSNPMYGRSSGSMGNPIFLGAYLAMMIPLTFARLVAAARMLRIDSSRKSGLVLACSCSLALALQGLALLYTQSRGPVIGLVVATYVCLFIFLILKRSPARDRFVFPAMAVGLGILAPVFVIALVFIASEFGVRMRVAGFGAAVVCVAIAYWIIWRLSWGRNWLWLTWLVQTIAFVLILSFVPSRMISASMQFSAIGRLAQMSDNSVDVRRFLWQAGLDAVRSGAPATMPNETRDIFHSLRPMFGYGPENTWFVANVYANPNLVRLHTGESVDRMHNETFDNLITLGLAGAAMWQIIMAAAFYYSLKLLGFTGDRKYSFILFSAGGSIAGILLPWIAGYPYLLGVGVIAGLIAGVVAYAAWNGFRNVSMNFVGDDPQVFVFCALGALIAHFVEIGVGVAVSATRLYFFILLAILGAFAIKGLNLSEEPIKQRVSKHARQQKNSALLWAALSSFAVLMLCWCFILNDSNETVTLSLFRQTWISGYPGVHLKFLFPGSLILLMLTLCGSLGMMYGEFGGKQAPKSSFRKTIAVPLGLMLCVWLVAGVLSAAFWTTSDELSPVGLATDAELRIAILMAALFLLMLTTSWQLIESDPARYANTVPFRARSVWVGALIVVCALVAIQELAMRPVQADMVCRIAGFYERSSNPEAAIQLYQRASNLAPYVVPYWISTGLAQASAGIANAGQMEASFRSLRHAVDLNPLDSNSYRILASVYSQDGERAAEPAVRRRQINKAIALFQQAIKLAPNYPESYCGLGRCYFLLGEHQKATDLYKKSLQMNPYYSRTYMFMGEMHYRLKNLERAYQDFETAARLNGNDLDALKNVGLLLALLGRKAEAIRANLHALEHAPNDYVILGRISALYFSQGDASAGHTYARRAYDALPAAGKESYEKFVAGLQNQ